MIWGAALTLAGIGVLHRIPDVMASKEAIGYSGSVAYPARFCFYVLAVLLIVGGARKCYRSFPSRNK